MPKRHARRRPAFTLVEVILVVVLMGLLSLIGIRTLQHLLDRLATHDAVRSAGEVVSRARDEAVALHSPVSVRIDTIVGTLELIARGNTFGRAGLKETHAVAISTTRDSITFDIRGLGYGPANLTLVARRGGSADTLVVSRLGRVRY